jgi:tetratricopeptide (TPR) repeat protein
MNVPFHLRRRPESSPAVALYWPEPDAAGLLVLCARLGLDPSGRIHAVSGGFLVKLDAPTARPIPGAIRLRNLSASLFLPVDADLVPALLDDEAGALVRDRGLVFLPGCRVLGFDPRVPLDLSALLVAEPRPCRAWEPLPDREILADRIEEVVVELPQALAGDPLEDSGEEIGTEEPRPEDSGPEARLRGGAARGAGRGLRWIGRTLGLKALADLGSKWVEEAREITPGLSQAVLGRQAAALRDLLREFREGDVNRALRHAPALGEPGGPRGAVPHAGARLPAQELTYSLGALTDRPGRGAAGTWSGGRDLMAELTREYRKAAEEAARRGDHRRAAVIYGRLLRDYRTAAQTLQQGGLHRDAAVLYLTRLDDPRAAARAFEAAGEVDRAVPLYRRQGEHERAGDLLRRLGEEEAALAEYRRAAEGLAGTPGGHLAAGDLLLAKAGRADLAREQFAAGWARRPEGNAVPCALRLAGLDAEAGAVDALRALLDEADAYFAPPGNHHEAGRFYNGVARLAAREGLAAARDELRDRALLGLATKLRGDARMGGKPALGLVSTLLGGPGTWPATVVSDADFAVRAASDHDRTPARGGPSDAATRRFRVGVGVVTAVGWAPEADEVFLGFEEGEVDCYRPASAEVVRVATDHLPVASLAASADGRRVVILRADSSGVGALSVHDREPDGRYALRLETPVEGLVEPWLTPLVAEVGRELVGLWDGRTFSFLTVDFLTSCGRLTLPRPDAAPTAALLVPRPVDPVSTSVRVVHRGRTPALSEDFAALMHDGREWSLLGQEGQASQPTGLLWRPCLPESSPLRSVPLSWAWDAEHLEFAGLGGYGLLHAARLRCSGGVLELGATHVSVETGGYLAAAIVRPGLIAGVTRSRIEWLRGGSETSARTTTTEVALPSAVACVPSRRTDELIVICADGFIARVPIPV